MREDNLHHCERETSKEEGYREAITVCYEQQDHSLWAGNHECGSQVAFCPYCGYEARIKPIVMET